MRALTSSSCSVNRKLSTKFFNSFIKPEVSHGLEVYSSASASRLKSLEVIQNSIRITTGLPHQTPVFGLHIESNFFSIFATINFARFKFFLSTMLFDIYFHLVILF